MIPSQALRLHRAAAAFRAIAERSAGLSFEARALPPLSPPRRPISCIRWRRTAASFKSAENGGPVTWLTIEKGVMGGVGLLERFGMRSSQGRRPARASPISSL
jgi:hypothetical protein